MKDIILLQEKYEKIYGNEATASGEIENIEEALDVILPFDFKEILSFYSGGLLGGISHFGTSTSDSENIVFETIKAREALGLPHHYVVLAEPPESLILLDTLDKDGVLWVDANDLYNKTEKWDTYKDFFQFLIEEEMADYMPASI